MLLYCSIAKATLWFHNSSRSQKAAELPATVMVTVSSADGAVVVT